MTISPPDVLRRLGAGEADRFGLSGGGMVACRVRRLVAREAASRAPRRDGGVTAAVRAGVVIERDRWGIPHVFADRTARPLLRLRLRDGAGPAVPAGLPPPQGAGPTGRGARAGRLAVGRASRDRRPEPDRPRTNSSGLPGEITTCSWTLLGGRQRAGSTHCGERLPIEFDLLDYRPEPWSPVDSLAIEGEFRWYLTGRFPVIVMPELAKRVLGDGPLYRDFLRGEADDESILPPERTLTSGATPRPAARATSARPPAIRTGHGQQQLGRGRADTDHDRQADGGQRPAHRVRRGLVLVRGPSLRRRSFNVAGMAYAGMPAVMFGRNERVAWGITNNICSLRDLYQEKTDPAHPGCFLYDGRWEPAHETARGHPASTGATPVAQTVRFSRNGPIVDEILPPPRRPDRPGRPASGWVPSTAAG